MRLHGRLHRQAGQAGCGSAPVAHAHSRYADGPANHAGSGAYMTSLPASLKLVCKTVDGWSDFWKHECLNKLKYLKDLNKEFSGQYAPTTEDIFTERILEIASDKYCPPEDFLGKEVCAATIDLHQTSDTIECQPALQSLFADCSFQEQSIILDIAIAVKQSLRNHVSL